MARLVGSSTPSHPYTRINVKDALGKARTFLAHVWVLEAFVGPRPPGALGRHLDDDQTNNRLENLAWGTPAENVADAFTNGGRELKTHCPLGHEIAGPNLQAKGRRCKACNQTRANAHWHGVPFTKEAADRRYEEVMS